ncbi:MBL fold metallo-hydrolase [Candidatus Geothermarchaeota archaeon ex4572_27]|nr:MAG: MBL fold metallo-hydrolase [Candidatus Geothermarchaeota archaeon ex4572_27]
MCGWMFTRKHLVAIFFMLSLTVATIFVYSLFAVEMEGDMLATSKVMRGIGEVERLKLVVLVDNSADPSGRCLSAWGLSIYVEADGRRILFDTGPSPRILRHNAEALGINISEIDAVVISHAHGDHIGGLDLILRLNPNVTVYVPEHSGLDRHLSKPGFVKISGTTVIFPGVAVIGELYGPPYEQALAINVRGRGLVVLVGCSHPGVDNIVRKAIADLGLPVYAVVGGFHLWGASEARVQAIADSLAGELGVRRISPLHCSGAAITEALKMRYPERYLGLRLGSTFVLTALGEEVR